MIYFTIYFFHLFQSFLDQENSYTKGSSVPLYGQATIKLYPYMCRCSYIWLFLARNFFLMQIPLTFNAFF